MFQSVIYKFIQGLKNLYERLDMAYQQTYTDENLGNELYREKLRRTKENRKRVLKKVKVILQKGYKKETGDDMPDEMAEMFAKDFYLIAKAKGDIDEFGNFVGEIDID